MSDLGAMIQPNAQSSRWGSDLQHQIDLLAKSLEREQQHNGALAATLAVVAGRIDALDERISVLRALLDASLNAPRPAPFPPPPMPGVPFPPPPGISPFQQPPQEYQLQGIVRVLLDGIPRWGEPGTAETDG